MKRQMKRQIHLYSILIVIGGILILGVLYGKYRLGPSYLMNQYMKAINNHNYTQAYELLYKENALLEYSEKEITDYMKRYYTQNRFLKLSRTETSYEGDTEAFYEVDELTQGSSTRFMMGLVYRDKKWQVIFPFESENIEVYAPYGSKVYMNDKLITDKVIKSPLIVEDVLPGYYNVRIEYTEHLQKAYEERIDVPEVLEVISPYETVDVSIEGPAESVLSLAGDSYLNKNGKIIFKNILEGNYTLGVTDIYGYLEPISMTLPITRENTTFNIGQMKLSAKGIDAFKEWRQAFYQSYKKGIEKGEGKVLMPYLADSYNPAILLDYENWFLKDKAFSDIQIETELTSLELTKENQIEAEILEVVYGDLNEKEYRIVLKWKMLLALGEEKYKLIERNLVESMVSQKSEEGKWLEY